MGGKQRRGEREEEGGGIGEGHAKERRRKGRVKEDWKEGGEREGKGKIEEREKRKSILMHGRVF